MRAKLAGLIVCCGLVFSSAYAATPATTQASTPELDKLTKQFVDAFGGDFELQKSLVTTDWEGTKTWLIEIKPRRAGVFVVQLDCRPTRLPPTEFSPDRDRFTWILDIGEQNQKRVLPAPEYDTINPTPLACVGDTVILPIQLSEAFVDFRFSEGSKDSQFAKAKANGLRGGMSEIYRPDDTTLKLSNEVSDNLRVVSRHIGASMNESQTAISFSMQCMMEAEKAGSFNITFASEWQASQENIAFKIVPESSPISVIVKDGQRDEYQGKHLRGSSTDYETIPPGTMMMREKDQIFLGLGEIRVPAHAPKPNAPFITIKRLPFAAQQGPFLDLMKDFLK